MKAKWYVAKVLMQSVVGGDNNGPWLCDEQIHLIRAPDESVAEAKALAIGKTCELSFKNMEGEIVVWQFIGLSELSELWPQSARIRDGMEITSRLFHDAAPQRLVGIASDQ